MVLEGIQINIIDEDDDDNNERSYKGKKRGPKKGEGGRPTKKNFPMSQIETLYSLGLTDEKVGLVLDVSVETIRTWKMKDKNFLAALTKGKEEADNRVVRALYERACGFELIEDDIRVVDKSVEVTPILKKYPPDTNAIKFWLTNRQKQEWRDKQDIEVGGKDGGPVTLSVVFEEAKPRSNNNPD